MLELKNCAKTYPGVQALSGVSLQLLAGEIHAICGENGAGKSTLMNIIAGNVQADAGELIWQGKAVQLASARDALALGIAIVHQERSLVNSLSIAENIFVEKAPHTAWGWIDQPALLKKTQHLLDELGLHGLRAQQILSDLSPAQKQMVEIAKALASQPQLLILDEPTSSLGEQETLALFQLLQKLKSKGTAIAYISHRMAEIFQIAERITVLKDGVSQGTFEARSLDTEQLIQLMVGRQLDNKIFDNHAQSSVRLQVQGLTGPGFRDISFEVQQGEIFGLAGLIGAGRTELALAIFGDAPISAGSICLEGQPVHFTHPAEAIASGIAYIPEERKSTGVFLEHSIVENVQVALLSKSFWLDQSADKAAEEYQEKLNIRTPSLQQKAGLLSGGNQQKVVLAKWLAIQPRLLIVDEPTQGIDVGAKAEIYRILKDLTQEGLSIVLISSELPELLLLSDRIGVMRQGELVGILQQNEATETRILSLAAGTHAKMEHL